MTTIFIAKLETRNFTLEGCGMDAAQARAALQAAIETHAENYGLRKTWTSANDEDVSIRQLHFGAGYRDGERITP